MRHEDAEEAAVLVCRLGEALARGDTAAVQLRITQLKELAVHVERICGIVGRS